MFYLLLLIAICAYPLQANLMAKLYRKFDPVLMISFRGLGIAITGSPIFLLLDPSDFNLTTSAIFLLVAASATGTIGVSLVASALSHITIGASSAIGTGTRTTIVSILGVAVLGDHLSTIEFLCICIITGTVISFATARGISQITISDSPYRGFALSMAGSTFTGISFVLFTSLSRLIDPLFAAYLWESTIGALGLILYLSSRTIRKSERELPTVGDFGRAMVFGSPTLVATGAFAHAVTLGSLPIASAILSATTFVAALFAALIHREFPSPRVWAGIGIIVATVASLKLFG